MTQKERYSYVLNWFSEHTPNAETELIYDNPYQLLVSVILSAQCTDKRVNLTTPAIFEKYSSPEALSKANFDELFPYISAYAVARCWQKDSECNYLGRRSAAQYGS